MLYKTSKCYRYTQSNIYYMCSAANLMTLVQLSLYSCSVIIQLTVSNPYFLYHEVHRLTLSLFSFLYQFFLQNVILLLNSCYLNTVTLNVRQARKV